MSLYSGFISKKNEADYSKYISRIFMLIQDQLTQQLQLSNLIINQQFFESKFRELLKILKELEQHKFGLPKFSNLMIPFESFLNNFTIIHNKNQISTRVATSSLESKNTKPITKEFRAKFIRSIQCSEERRGKHKLKTCDDQFRQFNVDQYLRSLDQQKVSLQPLMTPRICKLRDKSLNHTTRHDQSLDSQQIELLQHDQIIDNVFESWRKSRLSRDRKDKNQESSKLIHPFQEFPINLEMQQREKINVILPV